MYYVNYGTAEKPVWTKVHHVMKDCKRPWKRA